MAPRTPNSKGPRVKIATSHAHVPRQVRIIDGQYKRTPLPVINADGPRPTSDRVRETVSNWLSHDLTGWRCVDIFAGIGALDFEAASRGAAHVTLVENHTRTVCALHAIHDELGTRMVDIVPGGAFVWLARQPGTALDVVSIDPPFVQDWTSRVLEATARVVKPDGVIYVEAAQQLADVSVDSYGGEPVADIELSADPVLHEHLHAGAVHVHLLPRESG